MKSFPIDPTDTYLPDGWKERSPGAIATKLGVEGGIIDTNIVFGWFIIFNNSKIPNIEGLKSRSEAFKIFQEKILEHNKDQ